MYCRYCGKELPDDSNFCPNCGANQKENAAKGYSKLKKFFSSHKILVCSYIVWCLIHIGLLLFSTPKGFRYERGFDFDKGEDVSYRVDYDLSNGFYPFNVSLSNVFQGKKHTFSFLKNVDVYDSTELFFYIILIPVIILEIIYCCPFFFSLFKKIKAIYSQRKKNKTNNKEEKSNEVNDKNEDVDVPEEHSVIVQPVAQVSPTEVLKEQPVKENGIKKMSLLRRFMGSIIDKFFILFLFMAISVSIRPHSTWYRLGTYMTLFNSPTTVYKYVDKNVMEKYGTNQAKTSNAFQRLAQSESEPPHFGSTKEADESITFTFIVANLFYYLFFEGIMSASLGKRMFGGVLHDAFDDKIDFDKALKRALYKGAIMLILVYVIHWGLTFSNLIVVITFFLVMDAPLLFSKRSLLDKLTGTTYVKM